MKIYLASRYSRHPETREVRDWLEHHEHKVTSRWIDCHPDVVGDFTESFDGELLNAQPERCAPLGQHDLDDIDAAETLISFTGQGGKGGRHVEMGYALARGLRLIVVGPREHIFHTLPRVERYPDWPALQEALLNQPSAAASEAAPLSEGDPAVEALARVLDPVAFDPRALDRTVGQGWDRHSRQSVAREHAERALAAGYQLVSEEPS